MNAFIVFFAVLIVPVVSLADTIRIAADNWCPFNCETEGDNQGILVEIAKRAFSKAGHELRYIRRPWSRAIEECRAGKIEGIVGAFVSDAPDFVVPEESSISSQTAFFGLTGSGEVINKVEELEKHRVGAILDYTYGEPLDSWIKGHGQNIELVGGDDPLELNIKKLLSKRISIVLEDMPVMRYYLKKNKLSDQIVALGAVEATPLHILFSPKNSKSKEYAKIFADEIRSMKASGELRDLLSKYGL